MKIALTFIPEATAHFIAATLFDLAIYATFALGLALLVERLWKTASAADRHGLWLLALIAGILTPILTRVAIAPASWKATAPEWITVRYDLPPKQSAHSASEALSLLATMASATPQAQSLTLSPADFPRSRESRATLTLTPEGSKIATAIAAMGSLALLLRLFLGSWLRHRLNRPSRPMRDEDWQQLLMRLQKRLGIRRSVDLRIHPKETIPLTWGHRRPVILLPQSASHWPEERREAVLLHELAHIRRWDCATQNIAVFLQALAWFHPLTWIALRRLSLEREQACDDCVIESGAKPSLYAENLLALAQACATRHTHGAIAMAQTHRLSTRIAAILDPNRPRNRSPLRLALVASALILGSAFPRPMVLATEPLPPLSASTNAPPTLPPTRAELATKDMKNLESALGASKEKQARLKSELESLKQKLGITDLMIETHTQPTPPPTETLLSKLDQLTLDLRVRITREESKLNRLKLLPSSELPNVLLTLYPDDPLLQQLSLRKETAESELETVLTQFAPTSPQHKVAVERVRSYQRKIDERVEGILRSLQIQLETTRTELEHLAKMVTDTKQVAMDRAPVFQRYFEKKRELEKERLMGDVLMRKLAQERFDLEITRNPSSVPVPESPLQIR